MTAITFQTRVQPWLLACFGAEIAADRAERNHRFLEESLELVQSCGCTASEAHQLVDYVFGRPVGEPAQEAGGVMVTLAALCLANSLDMHEAGETELARIWTKVEAIRAKQAAKPKHSPLPAAPAAAADTVRVADLIWAGDRFYGGGQWYSEEGVQQLIDAARKHAAAAPALEAPAASAGDEEAAFTKWFQGEQGKPYQGMWEFARAAWMGRSATAAAPQAPAALDELGKIAAIAACWGCDHPDEPGDTEVVRRVKWAARQLRAVAQAPAAPSALAAQVIENLLQLARIVNTAVEDWGETKEDDSMEVIFHKEQADKLEEILDFFDSLPDAPPEEGVILSGPSRAARVLRGQAAPAAPVVLGWVHRSPKGHVGNHFYTYEPHCDTAVRDGGGEKIAVIAFHEAAPAAPAVDVLDADRWRALEGQMDAGRVSLTVHHTEAEQWDGRTISDAGELQDYADSLAAQAKEGGEA
ncbi:hypothetical protein [Delftia sp. HK171]|uniref:hypothetical protein n=1 Tax=Delftia sp. HK171 TaxID=1920191 RepID=UPI00116A5A43|nr:hypothetical protein [Delftia sp. HK171]TQL83113.1 hypothetical protein FB549_0600 [Delftia sp. HK171]